MEENQPVQQEEQDLLKDIRNDLIQASGGKRFVNYIIDYIAYYVFMIGIGFLIMAIDMDLAVVMYGEPEDGGNSLISLLINIVFFALFMGVMETVLKGRSVGKLITGTIAVDENGNRITGNTAMLRGLCRIVPFEPFSAFGSPCYPWHDKWTKSYVVSYKEFEENERMSRL